jgi:hypothetical protein
MVDFNNISCNTVKDFAMEYSSIFMNKEHYEEFNIKRMYDIKLPLPCTLSSVVTATMPQVQYTVTVNRKRNLA